MRTVRTRLILDESGAFQGAATAYYARERNFSPMALMIALAVVSAAGGIYFRPALVFGCAICVFVSFSWLVARWQAAQLRITRIAPRQSVCGDEAEVEIELANRGLFALHDLVAADSFAGTGRRMLWAEEPLRGGRKLKLKYRIKCDFGMGVFEFGAVEAMVSDPIGLFHVWVREDAPARLEIFPRMRAIPELPIQGHNDTFVYGTHTVSGREASINFCGIRNYQRGDSLRHIAWRVSARRGKLMVKEFETNVGTTISLLLDMSRASHAGRAGESSWDLAKNIAFSILAQQAVDGNSFQLLSPGAVMPVGRGKEHVQRIIASVFHLEPAPARADWMERFEDEIPAGSTAIYVGAVLGPEAQKARESLRRLRVRGVDVIAILIDARSFVRGPGIDLSGDALGVLAAAKKNLQESVDALRAVGVTTYVVRDGDDVGRALLQAGAAA